MIIGSILFTLVIVLFLVIYCAIRKGKSERVQKFKTFLKRKVYLNPVLRYLMLEAIKLNFVAMNSLKRNEGGDASWQLIPAICIFISINLVVPFLLARLLYRKRKILEEPEVK